MPSRIKTVFDQLLGALGVTSRGRGHLQIRLVVSILVVGLATAAISLSLIYFVGKHNLQQSIGKNFQTLASVAATDLDTLLSHHIRETQSLAASATVFSTIEESILLYEGSTEEETLRRIFELEGRWVHAQGVDAYLLELLTNKEAVSLREYLDREREEGLHHFIFVTNSRGAVVAATKRPPHYYYGDQRWWKKAYNRGKGQIYVSSIEYDPELDTRTVTIAAPVLREEEVVGIIVRILNPSLLFSALEGLNVDERNHTMLATSDGEVIVCSIDPPNLHRLLDPSFTDTIFKDRPGWTTTTVGPHYSGKEALNGFAPVPVTFSLGSANFGGKQWYVFTSQDPKETYASIYLLLKWVGIAGFLGAVVLLGLTILVSRRIVRPILDLQKGTEIIGAGNLNHHIQIATGDEIEDLATKFNDMTYRLKISQIRLEQIVKERTRELEQSNRELTILYALTSTLNHSSDLEEILSETLGKMLGVMKASAGVIWMPDPKTSILSVRLAKQFDQTDSDNAGILRIMDYVNDSILQTSQLWSATDLLSDERIDPFKYKDTTFKSLVAVPLVSKYKVLGILHLLYRDLTAHTSKQEKLLASLGSQIGVAIEHALLFAKNLFKEWEGPPHP